MSGHLSFGELIDLAEGTRARSAAPHLDRCEVCRHQVAELRAAMSAAAIFDVPDPSPLFWDHLSQRVREAVREEGAPGGGSWFTSWTRVGVPLAAGAVLAVLLAALVGWRGRSPEAPGTAPALPSTSAAASISAGGGQAAEVLASDPSLSLVADLAGYLDWETAREAGLASSGSAEHAVAHLDQEELQQLQRLLQMEVGRPGA